MNQITFTYQKSCGLDSQEIGGVVVRLQSEIDRIKNIVGAGYDSEYASVNVPSDEAARAAVKTVIHQKKALHPSALVVIGIGGSNLGTQAVQEAVLGKFYNLQEPEPKIYYADTVDSDLINDLVLLVEQLLEQEQTVLINIVSKSGTTTETSANAEIFLEILKNYYGDEHHNYVIVTTDKDSALWVDAQQKKYACLAIPKKVGGRYSVFTAVGLFPLGLLGVDIDQLCAGAQRAIDASTKLGTDNAAAVSAALLYQHNERGVHIHDTFLFSVDLESTGKWYRQLMGESVGKECNRSGDRVEAGLTPTVSIGSTDLHSVGQLYLGGPRDKFTTFILVDKNKSECMVPDSVELSTAQQLRGKPLIEIMNAIVQGTQTAYQEGERPFVTIRIPEKNAYYIGYLLQMKMVEMIYLGFLLNVNPFDQPNVESYKRVTRKLLAHE